MCIAFLARYRADREGECVKYTIARLYGLEAALDDVDADLGDRGTTQRGARAASAYAEALAHLRDAAVDLRGFVLEPVTT